MRKFRNIIYAALLAAMPLMSMAQQKGIQFEQGLSWQQVQEKAKSENKYIFVDCFASWCGPCKAMDRDVYTEVIVGDYFNKKFISVKLQIDTSKGDDQEVRDRYADARNFMQQYKITAFPSFFFFSPDGKIVHKGIGVKDANDFIALGTDALNPEKQYYSLLEKYEHGKKDFTVMPYLIRVARSLNDTAVVGKVVKDYTTNYLMRLSEADLYIKDNIAILRGATQSSKDFGFGILFHHAVKIDTLMGDPSFAEGYIDYIIAKEEIDPNLFRNGKPILENPNWEKMTATIIKKYNKTYATRTIIGAKVRWYGFKKDWPHYATYLVAKYDLSNGMSRDLFTLDNDLFAIFQHSTNKKELNQAIFWMGQLFKNIPGQMDAANMDTYANLLYKTGRAQEALIWEAKAARLDPEEKEIQANYEKMKQKQPTWSTN